MEKPVLLYDGYCGLCGKIVKSISSIDKKKQLRLLPIQSDEGQVIMKNLKLDVLDLDSVILIEKKAFFIKSTAAIKAFMNLGGMWKLTGILLIFSPCFRDRIYDMIASRRFRLFGKSSSCYYIQPEDNNSNITIKSSSGIEKRKNA